MTAVVLADERWHLGVLDIVAARLSRDHDCPAILFTKNGDTWKGSGRSPDGIDIMACLNRCSDVILAYGGHSGAAGVALTDDQLRRFPDRFSAAVTEVVAEAPPAAERAADAELPLTDVTPQLADQLERLEPFGEGNPEPTFVTRHLRVVSAAKVGARHCRFAVVAENDGGTHRCNAIYFNAPECPSPGDFLSTLTYHVRWNRWNGRQTLQLLVVSYTTAPG